MMFDIILIVLFLLTVWRGWRKGFISTILKFACFLVAGALCFFFRDTIADFAMNMSFAEKIGQSVNEAIIYNSGKLSEIPYVSEGIAATAEGITRVIVTIIACVVIFIVLVIIFRFLTKLINKILKLIRLGFVDDFLGAVLGAFNGYIIIYVIILTTTSIALINETAYSLTCDSMLVNIVPSPIALYYIITNML